MAGKVQSSPSVFPQSEAKGLRFPAHFTKPCLIAVQKFNLFFVYHIIIPGWALTLSRRNVSCNWVFFQGPFYLKKKKKHLLPDSAPTLCPWLVKHRPLFQTHRGWLWGVKLWAERASRKRISEMQKGWSHRGKAWRPMADNNRKLSINMT